MKFQTQSVVARFLTKVNFTGECWVWEAYTRNTDGLPYGQFWSGSEMVQAHRFSWELYYGPIPKGLNVCHRCDNPPCVRPDHLFLGTDFDNMRDCARKQRCFMGLGEQNANAKLSLEQVQEIRLRWEPYVYTAKMLAAEFNVSVATIEAVLRGKTWKSG